MLHKKEFPNITNSRFRILTVYLKVYQFKDSFYVSNYPSKTLKPVIFLIECQAKTEQIKLTTEEETIEEKSLKVIRSKQSAKYRRTKTTEDAIRTNDSTILFRIKGNNDNYSKRLQQN